MRYFIDLTGQRFGFLTALRRDGNYMCPYKPKRDRKGPIMWLCRCDCGQEIRARSDLLIRGRRKSCALNGHKNMEYLKAWPRSPRHTFPSEFGTWQHMLRRCYEINNPKYRIYGARGISVCERWRTSFDMFLRDMGRKPTPKHTIDRIDNDGNYEPGNCRWATAKEQGRNLRRSVYVEHNGERQLLMDVADRAGLNRAVIYGRLKMGWSLEDSLTTPVRPRRKNRKRRRKKSLDPP